MRRQEGFSLIEILITMLIMSVGLLGIAGIILTNLKNNQSAHARGQATVLVNDIVDRMRANRGATNVATAAASPYKLALGAHPAPGASIASQDVATWATNVSAAVPDGKGMIVYNPIPRTFTITVQWNDTRAAGDGATFGLAEQSFVVETRL